MTDKPRQADDEMNAYDKARIAEWDALGLRKPLEVSDDDLNRVRADVEAMNKLLAANRWVVECEHKGCLNLIPDGWRGCDRLLSPTGSSYVRSWEPPAFEDLPPVHQPTRPGRTLSSLLRYWYVQSLWRLALWVTDLALAHERKWGSRQT